MQFYEHISQLHFECVPLLCMKTLQTFTIKCIFENFSRALAIIQANNEHNNKYWRRMEFSSLTLSSHISFIYVSMSLSVWRYCTYLLLTAGALWVSFIFTLWSKYFPSTADSCSLACSLLAVLCLFFKDFSSSSMCIHISKVRARRENEEEKNIEEDEKFSVNCCDSLRLKSIQL